MHALMLLDKMACREKLKKVLAQATKKENVFDWTWPTKLGNQQQDSRHVVPHSTKTEKQIAWAKRPWPQRHETHLALLGVEKSRRSGDERTGEKWTASANRFRRIHVLGTLSLRSGKKKVAAPAATRARKSQDTDAHACALDENPPLSYLACGDSMWIRC
ncbi:uncharacterized protein BKA78DRAFT_367673 [Phyllosticta capitalensis]|uniref:uncharacterized protein n=1 Tax=Phyllosticta capitalensis TaxID=121624 RepID=UPI00312DF8F4